MPKFYFTFRLNQGKLAHHFLVIEANNELEARDEMCAMFKDNWASVYSEEQWIYKKGTVSWHRIVLSGLISEDIEEISQDKVYNLQEIKL